MRKRAVKMSCFYIPAICLILFFVVRPFCETVYVSLCKWNGYSPEKIFIGLENYKEMFSDKLSPDGIYQYTHIRFCVHCASEYHRIGGGIVCQFPF